MAKRQHYQNTNAFLAMLSKTPHFITEQYITEQYITEQYITEQYIAEQYIAEQYIAEQYIAEAIYSGRNFYYTTKATCK